MFTSSSSLSCQRQRFLIDSDAESMPFNSAFFCESWVESKTGEAEGNLVELKLS